MYLRLKMLQDQLYLFKCIFSYQESFCEGVVWIELQLSLTLFKISSLRLTCKLFVFVFSRSLFVEVFYATEQTLLDITPSVVKFPQRFYYCPCSLWARLFLRKIHVHSSTFPVIVVVQGSALQINLPYIRVTLVERRLSGRAAVTQWGMFAKGRCQKTTYYI